MNLQAYHTLKEEDQMLHVRRKGIFTGKAPKPVGPYSQAITADGVVFVSGQLGMAGGELAADAPGQARLALENMRSILEAAGASMEDVVKTTVLLADMNDFAAVNAVYAEFFTEPFPARAAYQVAGLPLGAAVEIEAVALMKEE